MLYLLIEGVVAICGEIWCFIYDQSLKLVFKAVAWKVKTLLMTCQVDCRYTYKRHWLLKPCRDHCHTAW